jgi:hypothetical protein
VRGAIANEKIRAISIIRLDDPVSVLVGVPVVVMGRTHKAKVHEEFTAAFGEAFGGFSDGLFPYVGVFFEINVSKRMVFKDRGDAVNMFRQGVELAFTG